MAINKDLLLQEFLDAKRALIQFLRHPLKEIKNIPDWPWLKIIIVQSVVAAICGGLRAIVDTRSIFIVISQLIINPIFQLITAGVTALFFYYSFQIFLSRTISLRQIFQMVFFASIPFYALSILTGLVPPIFLVGFAFTSVLLIVGMVEKFQVEKKFAIRLLLVINAIVLILWILQRIETMRLEDSFGSRIEAPEVELGQ